MPELRVQRVLSPMREPVARDDAALRAAKLRMLRYLSEPALPFLPENGAA